MNPTVILKKHKAKPFWHGESIVFSGAINTIQGDPKPAELVQVYDAENKLIGFGIYNPFSNYRVRLVSFAKENLEFDIEKIILYRLTQALQFRKSLNLPNEQTNAYRLCNSEGDYLSGVIIDVFDYCAVVYVTAYWTQLHTELIQSTLKKIINKKEIYWRPQQKSLIQDGWNVTENPVDSNISKKILIKENGILFQADLTQGQKTGFYLDQRENRYFIRKFSKDKTVLDCFCYTGGFALNAAFAEAKSVLGIDSSQPAIDLAKINADLNYFQNISFETKKVTEFLVDANGFDFIILDPPKLASSKKDLFRATQHYLQLNKKALAILPKNGLLFTCSCSDAMQKNKFLEILQLAAKKAKRKIQIINIASAAEDHRIHKNALYGNYLKAVLLKVI